MIYDCTCPSCKKWIHNVQDLIAEASTIGRTWFYCQHCRVSLVHDSMKEGLILRLHHSQYIRFP